MKIHYFFRHYHQHQNSIEKLFNVIIHEVAKREETVKVVNPFEFSLIGMLRSLLFFRSRSGEVNHITGDIHWAAIALPAKNTVLTIHDLVGLQTMTGIKRKLYFELWVKMPLRKLKYITVISDKTKDEIISVLPDVKNKITVIPNCLTTDISQEPHKVLSVKPEVLIVGTRSNKNIDKTLLALKNLQIHLTVVGVLSQEQEEFLLSYEFDFNQCINITNEEIKSLYEKADILLFASLYEGFGLPILEAQAQNCVVITSDISPMKDVAGESAILVNPQNTSEIREAVLRVIEDQELRYDLQLKGKENIKKYVPSEIAKMYIQLYQDILQNL